MTDERCTPWFLATDVCKILALGNVGQAVNGNERSGALGLDPDEKGVVNLAIRSASGVCQSRRFITVNESGLYRLVFKSRTAGAEAFQKWVTSEVLPQIRKTGSYSITKTAPPATYAEALRALAAKIEESPAAAARKWADQYEALSHR